MLRSTIAFALALLASVSAQASPLDLGDPTPRAVRVEIDQESHDFSALGAAYSLPMRAAFASNGVTATVTLPGSAIEAFIDDYFDGFLTAVHGTFVDYVITLDLASHNVVSATFTGTLSTIAGPLAVSHDASSTGLAGFEIAPLGGFEFPMFCTAGAPCTLVAGQPYDPFTGRVNAVGEATTLLLNVFTPFGDLRFTEVPPLECDTSISGRDFVGGEAAKVGLAIGSNQATDRALEVKVWIERSDGLIVSAVNRGAAGDQQLAASQVVVFPPSVVFIVNPSLPLGSWAVGCRLLDPVTGETLVADRDVFELRATRP
jgi:hypothetical protein